MSTHAKCIGKNSFITLKSYVRRSKRICDLSPSYRFCIILIEIRILIVCVCVIFVSCLSLRDDVFNECEVWNRKSLVVNQVVLYFQNFSFSKKVVYIQKYSTMFFGRRFMNTKQSTSCLESPLTFFWNWLVVVCIHSLNRDLSHPVMD